MLTLNLVIRAKVNVHNILTIMLLHQTPPLYIMIIVRI